MELNCLIIILMIILLVIGSAFIKLEEIRKEEKETTKEVWKIRA